MSGSNILVSAESYVRQLFSKQLPDKLCFHNLAHTEMVVKASKEISQGMQLTNEEREIILIAAWFHDTGYIRTYAGHEEESKNIAREFLQKNQYTPLKISKVLTCIAATQLEKAPKEISEKVLRDADLYHLSSSNYFKWLGLLRKEWETVLDSKVSDDQWHLQNLDFLHQHNYCTAYGQKKLEKGKQANLKKNIQALEGYYHDAQ
ncbi:hypothetical protein C900_00104 [Fulvivirga imtechensis AK7]|uniref:HD domain-containing protein n=1 Tax=Fulvivirga imtechensis AK7 TaxID=1237149 RepID=L8JZD7_9BACT|nr:HD domain-containing protein [Fulvivirga imtechensis]ELR73024.1 hypothetical protein C900_00104 [Fulvivirga imtechensis AK7]